MATGINNNPGFCAALYDSSVKGMNWLGENTKSLTASAGDVLGKVWSAVSDFFSSAAKTLGEWFSSAGDALVSAKNRFAELPRETQVVAGVTMGVSLLAGVLLGRCCGSRAAGPNPPANAAQQQRANANNGANPPANA